MLNLDFQHSEQGLIPNRAFFPLYVPHGDLTIQELLGENMLVFMPGEGLDIPHSSLIQPDGSEWIVTVQLGAYPEGGNGMVLSQCNDEFGYAIYLKDGSPRAVVRTGNCSMILKEDRASGITDCRTQLCTVELRIMKDMAFLTINRKRAAIVTLDAPLNGEEMPIHLGAHKELPVILQNISGINSSDFFGAVSALKIWRQ
ncbi:MAG: hypothetical protein JXR25_06865 [Pontiellaceae bacterium]|nr:hypothetical protein [Pontiellaceae bacterium]